MDLKCCECGRPATAFYHGEPYCSQCGGIKKEKIKKKVRLERLQQRKINEKSLN